VAGFAGVVPDFAPAVLVARAITSLEVSKAVQTISTASVLGLVRA
jgi:hypothetical protein